MYVNGTYRLCCDIGATSSAGYGHYRTQATHL